LLTDVVCRYLQERIHQVENERGHALSTIAKYKVIIDAIVTTVTVWAPGRNVFLINLLILVVYTIHCLLAYLASPLTSFFFTYFALLIYFLTYCFV